MNPETDYILRKLSWVDKTLETHYIGEDALLTEFLHVSAVQNLIRGARIASMLSIPLAVSTAGRGVSSETLAFLGNLRCAPLSIDPMTSTSITERSRIRLGSGWTWSPCSKGCSSRITRY